MRFLPKLSKRLKLIFGGLLLILLAAGGFLFYRISAFGYPKEFALYSMRADGTDAQRITAEVSITGSSPAWSPDRKRVLFEAKGDIYILEGETARPKRLTNAPEWDLFPVFSPDGQTIAFTSDRGGKTGIYLMSAEGKNQRPLSTKDDNEPAWSPNGEQLVFDSGRKGAPGLYLINRDGSGLRRLTRGQHYSSGQGSSDYAASWSPDGSKIAFTSNRTGENQLYLMNSDGSNQRRLTKTDVEGEALQPAWSPDGSKIAFMSGLGKTREIYIINTDGTGLRRVTTNSEYDGSPAWSPDGSRIAYISTRGL